MARSRAPSSSPQVSCAARSSASAFSRSADAAFKASARSCAPFSSASRRACKPSRVAARRACALFTSLRALKERIISSLPRSIVSSRAATSCAASSAWPSRSRMRARISARSRAYFSCLPRLSCCWRARALRWDSSFSFSWARRSASFFAEAMRSRRRLASPSWICALRVSSSTRACRADRRASASRMPCSISALSRRPASSFALAACICASVSAIWPSTCSRFPVRRSWL